MEEWLDGCRALLRARRAFDRGNSASRPRGDIVLDALLHQTSDQHTSFACGCLGHRRSVLFYSGAQAWPLLPFFCCEYWRCALSRTVERPGRSVVAGCRRTVLSAVAVRYPVSQPKTCHSTPCFSFAI